MSKSSSSSSSGGIGFAGALTITFIVLKLCNVIDWSWWWVLSPSLISIGLVLLILAGYGGYLWYDAIREKKQMEKEFKEVLRGERSQSKFLNKLQEAMEKNKQKIREN
jgi:ABC-type multidrug transport system fused ATPase/permease subunit